VKESIPTKEDEKKAKQLEYDIKRLKEIVKEHGTKK
jgi:hypothetical protein